MSINVVPDEATLNLHKVKTNIDIIELEGLNPEEIDLWVEQNVTSFVDVRKVVKVLLKRELLR